MTYALFVAGKQGYKRVCFNKDFAYVLAFGRNKYAGKKWFITDSMVYGKGKQLVTTFDKSFPPGGAR